MKPRSIIAIGLFAVAVLALFLFLLSKYVQTALPKELSSDILLIGVVTASAFAVFAAMNNIRQFFEWLFSRVRSEYKPGNSKRDESAKDSLNSQAPAKPRHEENRDKHSIKEHTSSSIQANIISQDLKRELIRALLICATISDRYSRGVVVSNLPPEIKNRILRNQSDLIDVTNIVTTCLDYPRGLTLLIDNLRFLEGNSTNMQKVDSIIRTIAPDPD